MTTPPAPQGEADAMRRDLRNEAEWLPDTLDDLTELRSRIIDAGYTAPVANGLCGWLVAKKAGEADVTASDTRSRYRQILLELGPAPTPAGPQRRRSKTAPQSGHTRLRTAMGVGATSAAVLAALSGQPAALALVPVILDSRVTSTEALPEAA